MLTSEMNRFFLFVFMIFRQLSIFIWISAQTCSPIQLDHRFCSFGIIIATLFQGCFMLFRKNIYSAISPAINKNKIRGDFLIVFTISNPTILHLNLQSVSVFIQTVTLGSELVPDSGIEPLTFSMSRRRSTTEPIGRDILGRERHRTSASSFRVVLLRRRLRNLVSMVRFELTLSAF